MSTPRKRSRGEKWKALSTDVLNFNDLPLGAVFVFAKREYNPYRGVYAKTGTSTMARLEVARNGSVSDMVASTEDVKSLVVNPAGIIIEHPTSTKPKRT